MGLFYDLEKIGKKGKKITNWIQDGISSIDPDKIHLSNKRKPNRRFKRR